MTDLRGIEAELESYTRDVRELRARADAARERLEHAERVLREAEAFIGERRRRAVRRARHHGRDL